MAMLSQLDVFPALFFQGCFVTQLFDELYKTKDLLKQLNECKMESLFTNFYTRNIYFSIDIVIKYLKYI